MYTFCDQFKCLPYEGGMTEQPARLVIVFDMIRTMIAEKEIAKQERISMQNAVNRGKHGNK